MYPCFELKTTGSCATHNAKQSCFWDSLPACSAQHPQLANEVACYKSKAYKPEKTLSSVSVILSNTGKTRNLSQSNRSVYKGWDVLPINGNLTWAWRFLLDLERNNWLVCLNVASFTLLFCIREQEKLSFFPLRAELQRTQMDNKKVSKLQNKGVSGL